ncbi:MAG: ras-related protein Rab-24 isoform [Gammaproteobacteria bacterium]|jgi:hypothetical protein|nr:ras-related protein Rab-24 isoform [Gammaproteobacteria bacterium]
MFKGFLDLFGLGQAAEPLRVENGIIGSQPAGNEIFKVTIVAALGEVKSQFWNGFKRHIFQSPGETRRIGSAFGSLNGSINEQPFTLHLWDTAGMEKYLAMTRSYLRDSGIVIVLVDLDSPDHADLLRSWLSEIHDVLDFSVPIYVCLVSKPGISYDITEIEELLSAKGGKYQLRRFNSHGRGEHAFLDTTNILQEATIQYFKSRQASADEFGFRPILNVGDLDRPNFRFTRDLTPVSARPSTASSNSASSSAAANGGAGRLASPPAALRDEPSYAGSRRPAVSPIMVPVPPASASTVRAASPQRLVSAVPARAEPAPAIARTAAARPVSVAPRRPLASPIQVHSADSADMVVRSRSPLRYICALSFGSRPMEQVVSIQAPRIKTYQDYRRWTAEHSKTESLSLSEIAALSNNAYIRELIAEGAVVSSHQSTDRHGRLTLIRDPGLHNLRRDAHPYHLSVLGMNCREIYRQALQAGHASAEAVREAKILDEVSPADIQRFRSSLADILGGNKSLFLRALEIYKQTLLYGPAASVIQYLITSHPDSLRPPSLLKSSSKGNFKYDGTDIVLDVSNDFFGIESQNNYYPLFVRVSQHLKFIKGDTEEHDKWVVQSLTMEGLEEDVDLIKGIMLGNLPADFLATTKDAKQCGWSILARLYAEVKNYSENHPLHMGLSLNDISLSAENKPVISSMPDMLGTIMEHFISDYLSFLGIADEHEDNLTALLKLYVYQLTANPFEGTRKFKLNAILQRLEPHFGDRIDAIFANKTPEQVQKELTIKIKCLDELYRLLEPTNDLEKCFMAKCLQALEVSEEKFWLVLEMAFLYREVYEYQEPSCSTILQSLAVFEIHRLKPDSGILNDLISKKIEKAVLGRIPYGLPHILLWEGLNSWESPPCQGAHPNRLEQASAQHYRLFSRGSGGAAAASSGRVSAAQDSQATGTPAP